MGAQGREAQEPHYAYRHGGCSLQGYWLIAAPPPYSGFETRLYIHHGYRSSRLRLHH